MTGWYLTDEIAPGLHRITEPGVSGMFRANAYWVRGRDADLQFDFCNGVLPLRPALPIGDRPVIAVASHAHVDHVGGFHEFDDRRGHAAEAGVIATMDPAATFASEFRENAFGPSLLAVPAPGFRLADWRLVPAPLTRELAEGDTIDIGGRVFTVLHLPGHSPGSIGLFDAADGMLLAGDAIYEGELLDTIAGASLSDYLATMARLATFDCRIAHCGHGPVLAGARMRAIAAAYLARRGSPAAP